MESDVDKALNCGECDAKFSSADHLEIHQRRHGMTLNLPTKDAPPAPVLSASLSTPSINKGSHSAGVISRFVGETPSPGWLIRNCEEVGLFQDLLKVNPFDEDFKKAANSASATPSGEGFEFSFSSSVVGAPGTPTILQETAVCLKTPNRSKRRYSDQDTLNTPQVFPYYFNNYSSTGICQPTLTTNTASTSACLTPTPNGAQAVAESVPSVTHHQTAHNNNETPVVSTTSYNHEEHVSIIAYTSAISQQTNPNKSNSDVTAGTKPVGSPTTASELVKSKSIDETLTTPTNRASSLKIRSKSNLKLDLKTVLSKEKVVTASEKKSGKNRTRQHESPNSKQISSNSNISDSDTGKTEILERNRAAAHRSRERRKQWIYGLESRCRALETLLAESQAEIGRLKAENECLRGQLGKSFETVKENDNNIVFTLGSAKEASIVIHHVIGTETTNAIQEPLNADNEDVTVSGEGMVATIVSPIVLPTVKAKRGRPKKGEERRIPIKSVPILCSSDEGNSKPKIPILPLPKAVKIARR